MSGSSDYSYNRFDAYEAKLKPQKEEEVASEESEVVEEGADMHRDAKRKELALKKEHLELFSAEEIELLGLAEAKCDKCEDDCECDDKKEKKSKGAKPDYIDADGDGDKEESMKKALEDKEGKKN